MLRLLTASIFLMAFVVQMFSGQFIKLDYNLNPSAYAKNCENKTRPKLHCNGKCQMMKKIQQEEKQERENSEKKHENKNEVLSSRSFFAKLDITSAENINSYTISSVTETEDMPRSIFHPPGV